MIEYKKITYNILATKLYKLMHGFDIKIVIKIILGKILKFAILLILYINSKSWYDCLIKLGIINEKQLMIDMINLY